MALDTIENAFLNGYKETNKNFFYDTNFGFWSYKLIEFIGKADVDIKFSCF